MQYTTQVCQVFGDQHHHHIHGQTELYHPASLQKTEPRIWFKPLTLVASPPHTAPREPSPGPPIIP